MSIVGPDGKPIDPVAVWRNAALATAQSLANISTVVLRQPNSPKEHMHAQALIKLIVLLDMAANDLGFCSHLLEGNQPLIEWVEETIRARAREDSAKN